MTARRAFVTGLSGQDGSYLVEALIADGVEVHALVRGGLGSAQHLRERVVVHRGDLLDAAAVAAAVSDAAPNEVFHLGGPTHVSDEDVEGPIVAGTEHILAAVRRHAPGARVFCASSAEVFGDAETAPQSEQTPLRPRNAYGAAKARALQLVRAARADGLWVAAGILFNHESPRRPLTFVTRKVTWHAAAIARGRTTELRLGALDACRDWGYAPEYVDGARRTLRAATPGDYVFATGVLHSVRELVEVAFARAGVPVEGHVHVDPQLVRPEGPVPLVGDSARAAAELGWVASKPFEDVIAEMVDTDLEALAA